MYFFFSAFLWLFHLHQHSFRLYFGCSSELNATSTLWFNSKSFICFICYEKQQRTPPLPPPKKVSTSKCFWSWVHVCFIACHRYTDFSVHRVVPLVVIHSLVCLFIFFTYSPVKLKMLNKIISPITTWGQHRRVKLCLPSHRQSVTN